MKDHLITISTLKAGHRWDGTLLTLPAGTMIDIDPATRKTRFTEPNGCRYLLKSIRCATIADSFSSTISAGIA